MCYCYVRMSERDITTLNDRLLSAVEKSRFLMKRILDEVEGLLDEDAEVDACDKDVCY